MNKKGMTLVELIATIVILSVIILLAMPMFMDMRTNMLEKELMKRIENVKLAALEYASQNNQINKIPSDTTKSKCYVIRTLIEVNYLIGDEYDKMSITNPLTGESLNNEEVCVKFDSNNLYTRKLVSFMKNDELEKYSRDGVD